MRLRFFRLVYIFLIFLVILRLAYWQIIKADDLTAKAEGQRLLTTEVVAPRGSIYFSDGTVLAGSQPIFTLFVEPKLINSWYDLNSSKVGRNLSIFKKEYSQKLATDLIEEDYRKDPDQDRVESTDSAVLDEASKRKENKISVLSDKIFNLITQDLSWVNLNWKVDLDFKKRLEHADFIGLGYQNGDGRFYPEGSSSAQLLGFTGSDAYGDRVGYFGVEGFYNGELKGKKGFLTQEKDALGLPILIGKFQSQKPKPGKDLVLNIDRAITHFAEEKLKKGIEKYGAKGGSVVIMDPNNGNILAMVSYPNYDPARADQYPSNILRNPITNDAYEPGSTFKVLVMAAGINENVVKRDTICDICSGPINLGGYTIRTWNNQYAPNSTMDEVIIHSDNTGMVFVSQKLGVEKMLDYINKFGFGSVSGIDLQDEQSPEIRDKKDWKEIDLATASFGQGISATPLQVVRAVAAIANGGKLYEPHVVSEIKDEKGDYKIKPRILENPISEDTARQVKEMMVRAVNEGEAKFAKPDGYQIAGKTGTAQIPVAGHYDPTKTIASFVGFAPADNPKFVMLVKLDEPSASIFGAETSAPIFFDIAKDLFAYYGIAPSE